MNKRASPAISDREIYSVSRLNREARAQLEGHFPLRWVEGEISNLARPRSGHIYFTLKDQFAQVRCALFKMRASSLRFLPEEGQQVIAQVRVTIYESRGDYQLIVERMEEAGSGALQRAFEALKAKLQAEQLFSQTLKQPIPKRPQTIGVVTSESGAALHDILTVLARRNPSVKVVIYPTAVQGEMAAPAIIQAIEIANRRDECELLIVGRGGGSLEDLWPFNEEGVARAIAASRLPVVSAVGHEVDLTIADLVADLRAPTPSAAAELVTTDRVELLIGVQGQFMRLQRAMRSRLHQTLQLLHSIQRHLRHPRQRIEEQTQRLDELELRLHRATRGAHGQGVGRLGALSSRLNGQRPTLRIVQSKRRLQALWGALQRVRNHHLTQQRLTLAKGVQALDLVSPLATIQRGYSITLSANGKIVKTVDDVATGERITTTLAQGKLISQITAVEK